MKNITKLKSIIHKMDSILDKEETDKEELKSLFRNMMTEVGIMCRED